MKNENRTRARRAGSSPQQKAGLGTRLGTKLERMLADIGWICGWRKERLVEDPVARRSSRRRIVLGRLVASVEMPAEGDFGSVETKFVSSGRLTQMQAEQSDHCLGVAAIVLDAQDELACQLNKAFNVAHTLVDPRIHALKERLARRNITRSS